MTYCPYCGKYTAERFSNEHVVPQSIWPGKPSIILVCKSCNDRAGHEVDVLLRRHPGIALRAHALGAKAPDRNDRIRAVAGREVGDARGITGHLEYESISDDTFAVRLHPVPALQHDERWINRATAGAQRLAATPQVRIVEDSRVEYVSFAIPSPGELNLERPFAKMLLGSLWQQCGESLKDCPILASLRSVVWSHKWGLTDSEEVIPHKWVSSWSKVGDSTAQTGQSPVLIDVRLNDPSEFEAYLTLFGLLRFRFVCPAAGWQFSMSGAIGPSPAITVTSPTANSNQGWHGRPRVLDASAAGNRRPNVRWSWK